MLKMCGSSTTYGIIHILAGDTVKNIQNMMTAADITYIKITYTIHIFKLQH